MLKFSKGQLFQIKTGRLEEHFCEIILKLGHWPRRRCGLMLFIFFSIFSSGGHFVQSSRIILAILVNGHKRNTTVKLLF